MITGFLQITLLLIPLFGLHAQQKKIPDRTTGEPMLIDSANTVFIPLLYNESLTSSDKLAAWGAYYANFIVYEASKDLHRRLFERDVYIGVFPLANENRVHQRMFLHPRGSDHILLAVKNKDTNRNGKIDNDDPSMLFTCTTRGEELEQLTDVSDNFVKLVLFEKQGFAIMTFQRDSDQDGSFRSNDKEFYLRKLDLKTMKLGQIIEVD
jgi:hypothetical protein